MGKPAGFQDVEADNEGRDDGPESQIRQTSRRSPGDLSEISGHVLSKISDVGKATTNHQPPKKVITDSKPPKKYAFEGRIIRLAEADFSNWQETFHGIADLRAELANYDLWFDENATGKGRTQWYHRARQRMNAIHQQRVAARQQGAGSNINESW